MSHARSECYIYSTSEHRTIHVQVPNRLRPVTLCILAIELMRSIDLMHIKNNTGLKTHPYGITVVYIQYVFYQSRDYIMSNRCENA